MESQIKSELFFHLELKDLHVSFFKAFIQIARDLVANHITEIADSADIKS